MLCMLYVLVLVLDSCSANADDGYSEFVYDIHLRCMLQLHRTK